MRAWPLAGFVNANAKACCAFGNIIRSDVECFTFPGGAILGRDGDVFDQVVFAFVEKEAGAILTMTSPMKPLNHGDLNSTASTNSGIAHLNSQRQVPANSSHSK